MSGRGGTPSAVLGMIFEERNKWVNATWMPHASVAQTSHVTLAVRSVATSIDPLQPFKDQEWQVRATVHGMAGIQLVPVSSLTPVAPLMTWKEANEYKGAFSTDSPDWLPMVSNTTHVCPIDALVQIPLRWRDLTRDSYIQWEVLGPCDEVLFIATVPLFNVYGKLQTGLVRVDLQSPQEAKKLTNKNAGLLSPPMEQVASEWQEDDSVWKATRILDQLERFEEVKVDPSARTGVNKAFGEIQPVPWLDAMAKQYCNQTLQEAREKAEQSVLFGIDERKSWLIIEFPAFEVPIIHEETFYPVSQSGPAGAVTPLDYSLYQQKSAAAKEPLPFEPLQAIPFLDYENENDNPVEDKYRTLAHDLLRGLVDPALKPDRVQRDRLAAIIASPSHHPSREEKDLLWRFRFSLVDNRRALTKFLLAVDWTVESEVVQAAELLEQWRKRSPIEVTDALKLLGKQVAYQTNLVRSYAIDTLTAAPDEELSLYLLQLVQALKFENIQETGVNQGTATTRGVSSLATFLIGRASKSILLANYLYWYLKVELQDPTHGARYREIFQELQSCLEKTLFVPPSAENKVRGETAGHHVADSAVESIAAPFKSIVDSAKKIGSTLRGTDAQSKTDQHPQEKSSRTVWDVLSEQDKFLSGIMDTQLSYGTKSKKDAKEAHLRAELAKQGFDKNSKREAFPLPCAPEVLVNGVNPQTAKVFKSAVYPALVEFHVDSVALKTDFGQTNAFRGLEVDSPMHHTEQRTSYRAMIKTGDDLRQDQLVIMMIKLMDGLLKRASLDMCLTPYSIIATSPTSGMIEFVEQSQPVSQILASNNNSILQFLQKQAPQPGAKYDVRPDVMANYIRSCAGYCVITYLLGVGDRHLDNLMITHSGNFFHIDFGFMFGRDPKPLPPAFRLTREMVEGMGGLESQEYRQFCSLACQAFNALRKSAGLVLNLLHLMSDAGIEDLSNNPSADADGVIAKVEERFHLELTDEQAERFFLNLVGDCLNAIAPRLMDVFHSIAVARR
eukprot:Nitzschia sp. Nitz4//scaffold119_size111653//31897//35236//NITZ4_004185-RA/size111653-augustus-gene-0.210-mRNA-1//1//CDS//3329533821//3764//frame0